MNARNILISVSTLLIAIIIALIIQIFAMEKEQGKRVNDVSIVNAFSDEIGILPKQLMEESLRGIALIGGTGRASFEKETLETDRSIARVFDAVEQLMSGYYAENTLFESAYFLMKENHEKLKKQRLLVLSGQADLSTWIHAVDLMIEASDFAKAGALSPKNDLENGVFQNILVKPLVEEVLLYVGLEQGYLLDLLVSKSPLDEERKSKIVIARESYMEKLRYLDFLASSDVMDVTVKDRLAEMRVALDRLEEKKREIYTTLLFEMGNLPSVESFLSDLDQVNELIISVDAAVSEPTGLAMKRMTQSMERQKMFYILIAIVVLAVLVGAAVLVQQKIIRPLGKQKELRIDFETNVQGMIDDARSQMENVASSANTLHDSGGQVVTEVDVVLGEVANTDTNVQAMASAIHELSASVVEINEQMTSATHMIEAATSQTGESQVMMDNLNEASQRIGDVVNIISDIADQTNLLALNASIEAARAGDAGRGFAVVAEEVRKLAEQTAQATLKIQEFVKEIQKGSEQANLSIRDVTEKIQEINKAAGEVQSSIAEQSNATESIAVNATDASEATDKVRGSVERMQGVLQQNQETVEEVSRVVTSTNDVVENLADASTNFLTEIKKI